MRVCPAGNGKGACACAYGQVSNIRLWPSPREDIGATNRPKLKASPVMGTRMTLPSSSGWNRISVLPADRKDGRRMLLWEEDQPVIGRWDPRREGWEDPENMHIYEDIVLWADILAPLLR
jgi:hypothetical protein